ALVLYEKLLPGSQLVNKLQDLNYRVKTISDPQLLVASAQETKPLVVIVDLACAGKKALEAITALHKAATTEHLPILAFGPEQATALQEQATEAGATLTVSDTALLNHLPQILEQV